MSETSPTIHPLDRITVNSSDLPVYCPGPNSPLWSMHPRVYIEIEKNGIASCPYCSATYELHESSSHDQ